MTAVNPGLDSDLNISAKDEYAGPQHVLDLPQLHSKPSAQSLLLALTLLTIAPSSWAPNAHEAKQAATISEDGVPSYLTRIISSPLSWIPSDTDKESVWEAASRRLAERAGRTAMPSLTRVFKIPRHPQEDASKTVDIVLHEPSLTGDNLGHKTWVASYLLAKRLPTLLPRHFPRIQTSAEIARAVLPWSPTTLTPEPLHVLELGAGTGLVGLAASALFVTTTHLTDLPSILPNLERNIMENMALTTYSAVTAAPLDWSAQPNSHALPSSDDKFDLILAADSLYAPLHPMWIVAVVVRMLKRDEFDRGPGARVMMELPLRCEEPAEHAELRRRMQEAGLVVVEEGVEVGFDDWEDLTPGVGQLEVRCWWCVWRWR